jgi:hypothetical protein
MPFLFFFSIWYYGGLLLYLPKSARALIHVGKRNVLKAFEHLNYRPFSRGRIPGRALLKLEKERI